MIAPRMKIELVSGEIFGVEFADNTQNKGFLISAEGEKLQFDLWSTMSLQSVCFELTDFHEAMGEFILGNRVAVTTPTVKAREVSEIQAISFLQMGGI